MFVSPTTHYNAVLLMMLAEGKTKEKELHRDHRVWSTEVTEKFLARRIG